MHTTDLYEGRTFTTLGEGIAHAEKIGFGEVFERGVRTVEGPPADLVHAGFSLGALPAQSLAQSRARGVRAGVVTDVAQFAMAQRARARKALVVSGWKG